VTTLEVDTGRRRHAIDITDRVTAIAAGDGFLWLSSPHTTAALVLSEADDDLLRDLERVAAEILKPLEPFSHHRNDNPNGAAHLISTLMGTTLLLRVRGGHVELGRFQRIVLVELDGPKTRTVNMDLLPAVLPAGEPSAK
jgi:secondary thiamine-phosphate synthase enzyme